MTTIHREAETHVNHEHGPSCGHAVITHHDHVDYLHNGHAHFKHDGHWDECTTCTCGSCIHDLCVTCDTEGCTCENCNHAMCTDCAECKGGRCANCECGNCSCPTCRH